MTVGSPGTFVVGRLPASLPRAQRLRRLAAAARQLRRKELEMITSSRLGHLGGDFSATDIVAVLVLAVLNVDPANPAAPERDRFVMSKGHSSASLYAALAAAGFFDPAGLADYMKPMSPLNGHPDRKKVPGVEANTGPLGHGLPIAVGMAIAARMAGSARRTFCLVGDGEMQEGSNWEALMAAGHRGLDGLTVIVDRNGLQQGAGTEETSRLEPLEAKAAAFNWAVGHVDGHSQGDLLDLFESVPLRAGMPTFIVAHTHKGYPVSFMQDRVEWHHKVPSAEQARAVMEELA
jgi:transketolase